MINWKKISLASSSLGKLKEYKSFGLKLNLKSMADLPEVQGTEEEVIIYKALQAGENILVEDTSLQVEGVDVGVNIKWLLNEIKTNKSFEGRKATWIVNLGLVYKDKLFLVESKTEGTISLKGAELPAFGFDGIFIPKGAKDNLFDLDSKGIKDSYSPRKKAIDLFLSQQYTKVLSVADISPWRGEYQK